MRPFYYDRDAVDLVLEEFLQTVVPHSSTTRINYTIPAGKKCRLNSVHCAHRRQAVATTAVNFTSSINLISAGSGSQYLAIVKCLTNGLDDGMVVTVPYDVILSSGDQLTSSTFDTSTGGQTWFHHTISLTLYDE